MILPSSQSHFFDYSQESPINQQYPDPPDLFSTRYTNSGTYIYSGIYSTNKKQDLFYNEEESGIFHYNQLSGQFSNYATYNNIKNNFQSFNVYIHYYPKIISDLDDINSNNIKNDRALRIPYLSSYKINTFIFNPYRALF